MSTGRRSLGRWGEALAARYLEERGYSVYARNAKTPYGEIDIVAKQQSSEGEVWVFVEVKTRSSRTYGYPEEAVTADKQSHMIAAAEAYLQEHPEFSGAWRLDVIAIERFRRSQPPQILHFENVTP